MLYLLAGIDWTQIFGVSSAIFVLGLAYAIGKFHGSDTEWKANVDKKLKEMEATQAAQKAEFEETGKHLAQLFVDLNVEVKVMKASVEKMGKTIAQGKSYFTHPGKINKK